MSPTPASVAAVEPLLDVRGLTIALPAGADRPHAVEGLTFTLNPNEILCVVGESGSGKSMTAHAAMGLLPKPHVKVTGGELLFRGRNVFFHVGDGTARPARWPDRHGVSGADDRPQPAEKGRGPDRGKSSGPYLSG
ncbi:ATP-binding cassette domain-containing protein [Novispirillum itersonii]|uniref:ATP-binding cassette domain-containing protein n=1 Tax=Novispirillum itersonii TaxID=189 RepID=UPI00389916EF